MSVKRIAARYAKSLIDLAEEQGKMDVVLENIKAFQEALKSRELVLMLKSPIIHGSKKSKVFATVFEQIFDPLMMEFFNIVFRKGRESCLPEIADAFIEQYNVINKISRVILKTAVQIDEEHLAHIKQKIIASGITYPNIELEMVVDPDLIGGFVVEIEDKLYDASVLHQLERLKKEFSGNPGEYHNN